MAKKGTTRYSSDIQEKRIQKSLGGVRTPNSGATQFIKGDNLLDDFFIEGKTSMTPVKSKAIKLADLLKAKEQAFFMRKPFYAMAICLGGTTDYYVMEDTDFEIIYEGYKKYQELLSSGLVKE